LLLFLLAYTNSTKRFHYDNSLDVYRVLWTSSPLLLKHIFQWHIDITQLSWILWLVSGSESKCMWSFIYTGNLLGEYITSYLIIRIMSKSSAFFYFIIFTFTYMCIHCLGHLPTPPSSSKTCSAIMFSNFVEEKT
jgi:hypothetical protein